MGLAIVGEERTLLDGLDRLLRDPAVQLVIDGIVARVQGRLADDPSAALAWEPVPLGTYGDRLPDLLRSSWVFVLRAGTTSGAERHPNSHQRVMSYRGSADMQTWVTGRWQPNILISDPAAPLEQRWLSIPVNMWHKPVMDAHDWVVVSFHTVRDVDLIEEVGGPDGSSPLRSETYLSRSDPGFLGAR